ncbi:hypothetical protein [Ornithinimicrobium sp. W1665]|uniref:hypothetical protein n=2 Tax=unclassified Ornithinimicrobium TaxID=2615080 RepID=UPI003CEFF8EF
MTLRSLVTVYAALAALGLVWWVSDDGLWSVIFFGAVVTTGTLHVLVRTRGLGHRRRGAGPGDRGVAGQDPHR